MPINTADSVITTGLPFAVAVMARNSRRERRWRHGSPQDSAGDEAAERCCFSIPAVPGHPDNRLVQQESKEQRAKRTSNPAALSTYNFVPPKPRRSAAWRSISKRVGTYPTSVVMRSRTAGLAGG